MRCTYRAVMDGESDRVIMRERRNARHHPTSVLPWGHSEDKNSYISCFVSTVQHSTNRTTMHGIVRFVFGKWRRHTLRTLMGKRRPKGEDCWEDCIIFVDHPSMVRCYLLMFTTHRVLCLAMFMNSYASNMK